MNTFRTVVAAAALFAALAGCGTQVSGSATPAPPPPTTASSVAPVDPAVARQDVEAAFRDYYAALRARNFTAACALHADETTVRLLDELRRRGVTATTCEEALTAVYAIPGNAEAVDAIAQSATVEEITVTGEDATIAWSATIDGKRETTTSSLRRIDNTWRLITTRT
jgi:ketosteroid isomerase-like protein